MNKEKLNSILYYMAMYGSTNQVRELLDQGADPNYFENLHPTLTAAVIVDSMDKAKVLLDAGANPNALSHDRVTPLMHAKSGNMVKLLAFYGADYKRCDGERRNALKYYIDFNCIDAVQAWIQLGWPVKIPKKATNRLLSRGGIEMATLLRSGQMVPEPKGVELFRRIAEYKAKYD